MFKFSWIDERVRTVKISRLRGALSRSGIGKFLGDKVYIVQGPKDENLAVIMEYEEFLKMQDNLTEK